VDPILRLPTAERQINKCHYSFIFFIRGKVKQNKYIPKVYCISQGKTKWPFDRRRKISCETCKSILRLPTAVVVSARDSMRARALLALFTHRVLSILCFYLAPLKNAVNGGGRLTGPKTIFSNDCSRRSDCYENDQFCDVRLYGRRSKLDFTLRSVSCHSIVLCSVAPAFTAGSLNLMTHLTVANIIIYNSRV